jgi:monovalent cation/proton antiporter MnhG/PhaG subunit
VTIVGIIMMSLGTLVSVLAAWGIIDFPSPIARMHASSKSASLGLAMIALGAGFASGSWGLVGVGAVVALFLFATAPVSGHMLGRATYAAGQRGDLVYDDLAGRQPTPLVLPPPTGRSFSPLRLVGLIIVWMLLWRDVSVGTLVGGTLVGLAIEAARSRSDRPVKINPLGMVKFVGRYAVLVFASNARVAWEVITPSNELIREAIVACPLKSDSVTVALIVANAVTFTPGTLSLELADDPRTLYVHVLHFTDAQKVRDSVSELEDLVLQALPQRAGR